MDFGRPTIFVVPKEDVCLLITPTMEINMAEVSAVVERVSGAVMTACVKNGV